MDIKIEEYAERAGLSARTVNRRLASGELARGDAPGTVAVIHGRHEHHAEVVAFIAAYAAEYAGVRGPIGTPLGFRSIDLDHLRSWLEFEKKYG